MTGSIMKLATLAVFAIFLTSCGGGGSSGGSTVAQVTPNPDGNSGQNPDDGSGQNPDGNSGQNPDDGSGQNPDGNNGQEPEPKTPPPPMPVIHELETFHEIPAGSYKGQGTALFSNMFKMNSSSEFQNGTIIYLSENINGFTEGAIDLSNVAVNTDTGIVSGTVSLAGTNLNVLSADFHDNGRNFGLILTDSENNPIVVTGGEPFVPFSSVPSGDVNYTGIHILNLEITSSQDMHFGDLQYAITGDEPEEKGTFNMTVNFENQSGSITASATRIGTEVPVEHTTYRATSSDLTIDPIRGIFSGNMKVVAEVRHPDPDFASFNFDNELPSPWKILGTFHGINASGVSGAYLDSQPGNPTRKHTGYIIGQKQ